jgi:hypothetical protein
MRIHFGINGVGALAALCLMVACASTGPQGKPFDVARVTLYDCGLAQMEREAEVEGEEHLDIRLQLAHLDDLLATLVVAARGDVRVTGVRYPSVFTLGQARAASSFANASGDDEALDEKVASELCGYVLAMVGTEVEVARRGGTTLSGIVIDCALGPEDESDEEDPKSPKEHLLLVSSGGAMAWVPLDQIESVDPLSEREGEAIHTYARHLGRAPGLGETTVRIETAPDSSGRLAAGYIQQAPVWRMTYKIRVREESVSLEAWGLVHNDTDEPWDRIDLSLVSGLPESYVMSVASPRYAERGGMYVDGETDMFPQLGAATPDSLLYEESVVKYSYGGGGYGIGLGSAGHAVMASKSVRSSHSMGVAGRGVSGMAAGASMLVKVEDTAVEETAEPKVEKEISTYRALEPVTIPPRASSMVPLLKRTLPGEAFTMVSSGGQRTCVRVKNKTGLVLQYGIGSFYINGRFRGQAELDRTEPGDIRVLCFGEDPDVDASARVDVKQDLKAIEFQYGNLYRHVLATTTTTHTLGNRSGQARQLALPVNYPQNGRIVSPADSLPGEGQERYVLVNVPPREEVLQKVVVEAGIKVPVSVSVPQLEALIMEAAKQPASVVSVLQGALKKAVAQDEFAEESALHYQAMEKVRQSLERKRESVRTIPQGALTTKAGNRLLEEMLMSEKRLEKMLEVQADFDRRHGEMGSEIMAVLETMPAPSLK